jgi:hypothetical protein
MNRKQVISSHLALVLQAAVVGLGAAVGQVRDDGLYGGSLLFHQLLLLLQLPNPLNLTSSVTGQGREALFFLAILEL